MKVQRTRSQEKIIRLLQILNRAVSAQDLYIELRRRKQDLGLATVYRSLEVLTPRTNTSKDSVDRGVSLYLSPKRSTLSQLH